jgi:hypothetical protein
MGSAVALAVGLAMTGIVFLLLGDESGRVAEERVPLMHGLLWSFGLAAVSIAAFYGELRLLRWRLAPQLAVLLTLIALGMAYWPR